MAKAASESVHVERSREVRLGVVMFGGISLAVYINGVANELFRASRGRGVYRLLKALTDSHVIVDILSGASAGGINSILLSTALCNETEFDDTGKLWRDQADIAKLLKPRDGEPLTHSVLNGEYHQCRMETAFGELLELTPPETSQPEDPSPVNELDLFITGTDIGGRFSHRLDALGHRIQLEDHRALFQLKHRDNRKHPFAPDALQMGELNDPDSADPRRRSALDLPKINKQALATLAHLTSCFPGAFVPMRLNVPTRKDVEHPSDPGGNRDGRLSYWGQLEGERKGGKPGPRQAIFMDGGVLKNKPFTSTIEAIFSRLADTQVSRYVLYIEPDPQESVDEREAGKPPDHQVKDAALQLGSVALEAASGLPRFESIDADLQAIETHNTQVRRYEALVDAATKAVMAAPKPLASQVPWASSAYGLARLGSLAQQVQTAVSEYLAPERVLPGAALNGLRDHQQKASSNQAWDVLFPFRRLIQLTYSADDTATVSAPAGKARRAWFSVPARPANALPLEFSVERELVTTLNRQIEVYEIVRARIEQAIAVMARETHGFDLGSAATWAGIEQRALEVLGRLPWPACFSATQLPLLKLCVTADELKALRDDTGAAPSGAGTFLDAAQAFEVRLLSQFSDAAPLLEMYERFGRIDEVALPLELVSGLRGRDQIKTVRVSPFDSKRAFAGRFKSKPGQKPINKLCGVQLFNFGAFFKSSWRSNDLLWGRIDGVSQLLDILLDAERLERLAQPLLLENLRAVLGDNAEKWDLSGIFPHSSPRQLAVLSNWLRELSEGNKSDALAALRGDALLEAWAHAAQLEVLAEELPQVFEHGENELEPGSEARAALSALHQKLCGGSPKLNGTAIDEYFTPDHYTLGQETLLADLPTGTLLRFADEGSTHLRAALENSLPDQSFMDRRFRDVVGTVLRGLQLGGSVYLRWRAAKAKRPHD